MGVKIEVTGSLSDLTKGNVEFELEGSTVREIIKSLYCLYPRLEIENPQIFLNGSNEFTEAAPVTDGATLTLVQNITGGR